MGTQTGTPLPRKKNRMSLFLRLWEHGLEEPVWIGEVRDVSTGETIHVQSMEALFDWLRLRTSQKPPSTSDKAGRASQATQKGNS